MRLFEILLLLNSAGLLVIKIFFKKNNRMPLFIASVVGTLLLVTQFMAEGYRDQLLFPYCITIAFLATSVYAFFRKNTAWKMPRFLSATLFTAAAASLLLTAGLLYVFPVFQLPKPTGTLKVGTQTFHFVDTDRKELFGEAPGGKRELMVQVWYPAQNTIGKPMPFIPGGDKVLKEEPMSGTFGIPRKLTDYLKSISSHSYENAEVSGSNATYPLIILNHGYGSSKIFQTSQAENLASHGYIVASIDHTYSTFATVFPDGRTTTMKTDEELIGEKKYRNKVGKMWTDDVSFTLDQLERINSGGIQSKLYGKIDFGRVGAFGHSFGGAASYDSAYDPRIKAGIDLDGSLYRYDKEPLSKPFMFIFSEMGFDLYNKVREHYVYTDEELKAYGVTREQIEKDTREVETQVGHLEHVAKHGGQILYIENMEHYNFADLQFLTPLFRQLKLTGKINPARSAFIVNAYTLDFFDKYLKDKGGSLIDGPSSKYPEVKFVTSLFAGAKK
ncbi:dienelactone hydrolase [Paenibacillus sp.]|jgi:predicted dienelactone hydrolase|uniref:alpha/beta hydrolase family protein n=1 Tax=Paenibacillus sp. TaxID=58172 RepID=UPI00282018F4|nr:dienelactone hydrolase [Paenibacillus sp.]MDR0268000.1 dienelactone hydrolase [Paenibacillus sp.]